MECRACGAANREGARFCAACGQSLAQECPRCGAAAPPGRFCDACGHDLSAGTLKEYTPDHLVEKILRDRPRVEGERRTVTVLFVDAVDSTPTTARFGDERVFSIMRRCTDLMLDAVHRYEGTVTQFRGDGVMALFGAPIAHEDSALRAVRAGLDMQRALTQDADGVAFRVGLHTGPVVVGSVSDTLEMDYTAIGDTVNLAARLEQMAEPGSVYMSDATWRAVSDHVDYELVGSREVKGRGDPITVYKATAQKPVRSRLEAGLVRGLTRFVGRHRELAVLEYHYDQASHGRGQVVVLTGEAGVGKSRLAYEFRRTLSDEDVGWIEGRCTSYGASIPYLPLVELIRGAFGVEEDDDEAGIAERLEARSSRWSREAQRTVPYLRFLLGIDPGDTDFPTLGEERRAGILDGVRALLREESRDHPLVVLIEDLHWADSQSEDVLAAVGDVVADLPVLMVATTRPGVAHTMADRPHANRLSLGNLLPEHAGHVAASTLQVDELAPDVIAVINARAEGNPFFVEEVTRSLVETGFLTRRNGGYTLERSLADLHLPDTIQGVILARIDRLDPKAKGALQLASVIGREFTVRLLRRISDLDTALDDTLHGLKNLELILEKSFFPELAYMFKHALTHDVARSTLLDERRGALHRVIASAIEELYHDRLVEHYETLAHHYEEAAEWQKALEYLVRSGDRASGTNAVLEAVAFYERATAVCAHIGVAADRSALDVSEKLGLVHMFRLGDSERAIAKFDEMRIVAERLGDRARQASAVASTGFAIFMAHQFEAAQDTFRHALEIAGDDTGAGFYPRFGMAIVDWVLGRFDGAQEVMAGLAAMVPDVDEPLGLALYSESPILDEWQGRYDDTFAGLARLRPLADSSPVPSPHLLHIWVEGKALADIGRYVEALTRLTEVWEMSERISEVVMRGRSSNTLGWAYAEVFDHERALEWNALSLQIAQDAGFPDPEVEANARLNLAEVLLAVGRHDDADEHLRWVERVVRNPTPEERWLLWRYSQRFFVRSGELALERGNAEVALGYADECLPLSEATKARKYTVMARRLRGRALAALDRSEEAEDEFGRSIALAREIGNPGQLWRSLAAAGRPAEALAVIEEIAAGFADDDLRATFLGAPLVEALRAQTRAT